MSTETLVWYQVHEVAIEFSDEVRLGEKLLHKVFDFLVYLVKVDLLDFIAFLPGRKIVIRLFLDHRRMSSNVCALALRLLFSLLPQLSFGDCSLLLEVV